MTYISKHVVILLETEERNKAVEFIIILFLFLKSVEGQRVIQCVCTTQKSMLAADCRLRLLAGKVRHASLNYGFYQYLLTFDDVYRV